MRRLIVNADDFGLTPGVNRAIIELHAAGLVTSTSLMARAGATDEAIELARATPSLGVGCHVVLVDGEPVLEPEKIPSLVDARTGRFPDSLTAFLLRLFTGRIRAGEIEAEAGAQIAHLQQRGVQLTHLDTHKHAHIFSAVLRPLLRAARTAGIRALRHPFEPEWAVRAAIGAPWARVVQIAALRPLAPRSRQLIEQGGFFTTDGTIAMASTGTLDAANLRSMLGQLPPGTWELVTHPGYNDADLARVRTRLRASRDVERVTLTAILEVPGIELISFAALGPTVRQATDH
ncbi:MAG TPA: ChbG/HpnK family deacetylase [Terracidiphilus sp.]|nr:ChbG/HpnK family deacetylase [Terracidiphilus sp.]